MFASVFAEAFEKVKGHPLRGEHFFTEIFQPATKTYKKSLSKYQPCCLM